MYNFSAVQQGRFLTAISELEESDKRHSESRIAEIRMLCGVCFSKEMSEIQVKQKLRQVFEKQLVDSEGKAVPRGGGTPLYTLYRYVPPDRVGFVRCSVLKQRILFGIFW